MQMELSHEPQAASTPVCPEAEQLPGRAVGDLGPGREDCEVAWSVGFGGSFLSVSSSSSFYYSQVHYKVLVKQGPRLVIPVTVCLKCFQNIFVQTPSQLLKIKISESKTQVSTNFKSFSYPSPHVIFLGN